MRDLIRSDTRVVHVIGALVAGGAERMVVSLLAGFASELRPQLVLLVLSSRRDEVGEAMHASLRDAGVEVHCGPTVRVGFRTVAWYARRLWQIRPAIVHLHTPNTELIHSLAGSVGRTGGTIIRTLHSTQGPQGRLFQAAYRRNRAAVSIACSGATESASRDIVAGEIVTIANGVDFAFPMPSVFERARRQRVLSLDPGAFHFLMVGRMNEAKAHDIVLAAWEKSGLRATGAELHLLGDGELRPAYEAAAAEDTSIQFHGVRSDVHNWLLACHCFVMPSRFEGLPMAGIEACGAGLPCIFSDIPPLRELESPVTSWVAVGDVDGLAARMRELRGSTPIPDSSSVSRFRSRYSIRGTAEQYGALYARVLGLRGTGEQHAAAR